MRKLVSNGLSEEQVEMFMRDKGAYSLDADQIAHCIKMGNNYNAPAFLNQIEIELDQNDDFDI